MYTLQRLIERSVSLALILVLCVCTVPAQQAGGRQSSAAPQSGGNLRGQVTDEFGGIVVGATVTIISANGTQKTVTTNNEGVYTFNGLAAGKYTVRALATGFAPYENTEVNLLAGRRDMLDIKLSVTLEKQEVIVSAEAPVSTDPENNAGAIVLRGTDLDALPDNPDDLADALQALAGPSAGPNGGQVFIDGFTGGRFPPKESIREIRINSNPFSAEYDRLGFGRIEILTRPGTDRFRGQGFFNFNDESLNSRNPYARNRAPHQLRFFGGNLSGPVSTKKASFFLDFNRRELDDNAIINATILDPSLNVTQFEQAVLTPRRFMSFSPRFDYQLNATNTLVGRYSYEHSNLMNSGIGEFSLPSRAFNTTNTEQTFQVTETAIINPKVVNETRFQYIRQRREQIGDNSTPSINVLQAFNGGGSQVGRSFNDENRFELQNYTTWSMGAHALKAGGRLRDVHISDSSTQNFGGAYTFAGGLGPQLDANNQPVLGANGQPVMVTLTSLERYRRTLLFQKQGLSAAQIRTLGGGATQFTISGGNPLASVSQFDFGGFIQDDWRYSKGLTLSLGLRYETQNNINSNLNFAPRLSFAWSPGAGGTGQPKTVIRGGYGIFYERFGESLTLQANRFNGTNQQQFVVSNNIPGAQSALDLFPNVPTVATLTGFAIPQTIRNVARDLQAPYTMQGSISVERALPHNITVTTVYINSRTLHALRSRNINAPLPGTFVFGVPTSGVRPLGNIGDIYQYESSGVSNQSQMIVSAVNRLSRKVTLFANYVLNSVKNDTDGAFSFPSDTYNLKSDYGRAGGAFQADIRHRFVLGGSFTMPWDVRLNPFIIANSSRPFNITTGRDTNGDAQFTERPAFATDLTKPGVIVTRFGAFDPNPGPGQEIIPRNYGIGPGFFLVNLRVSKTFGFGPSPAGARQRAAAGGGQSPQQQAGGQQPGGGGGREGRGGFGGFGGGGPGGGGGFGGGGRGGGGGPGGGGFGGGGGLFGGQTEKRYNVTFSINFQNLLNHTNPGTPIGNLLSPLFGQSNQLAGFGFGPGGASAAGNRRIEAQIRFSF